MLSVAAFQRYSQAAPITTKAVPRGIVHNPSLNMVPVIKDDVRFGGARTRMIVPTLLVALLSAAAACGAEPSSPEGTACVTAVTQIMSNDQELLRIGDTEPGYVDIGLGAQGHANITPIVVYVESLGGVIQTDLKETKDGEVVDCVNIKPLGLGDEVVVFGIPYTVATDPSSGKFVLLREATGEKLKIPGQI